MSEAPRETNEALADQPADVPPAPSPFAPGATTPPVTYYGFPQQGNGSRPVPVVRPSPVPRRPRGRWFLGVILLAIIAVGSYNVWHAYFRYRAYGTVTGHMIAVSPPWD